MKQSITRYLVLTGLVAILLASGCQQAVLATITMPKSTKTTTSSQTQIAAYNPSVTQATDSTLDEPPLPTTTTPPLGPSSTTWAPPPPNSPTTTTAGPAKTSEVPGNNTPPKQVTGLLAMALGTNEIMLTWDPSNADDLKCYNVYRSTSANNNYIWLFSPSENYYRDTGLDQSVAYYYYVTAIDYSNNESYKPEKPEQSSGASAITLAPVVLELFGREN